MQPLPVRHLDDILNYCPNYDHLSAERKVLISSQVESIEEENSNLLSRMGNLFNLTKAQQKLEVMKHLYDTVYADLNIGRKMPAEFN